MIFQRLCVFFKRFGLFGVIGLQPAGFAQQFLPQFALFFLQAGLESGG